MYLPQQIVLTSTISITDSVAIVGYTITSKITASNIKLYKQKQFTSKDTSTGRLNSVVAQSLEQTHIA